MSNLTKPFILNIPNNSEIPSELCFFSPDENFLLLKVGTNVIIETKKSLININNFKILY